MRAARSRFQCSVVQFWLRPVWLLRPPIYVRRSGLRFEDSAQFSARLDGLLSFLVAPSASYRAGRALHHQHRPPRRLRGEVLLAFDGPWRLCYKHRMTATLSVRLPADDKRRLFDAAARQGRSANDLVREAIRREVGATRNSAVSPLAEFFGSVDSAPPAPTNAAVRRSMRRGRK